jgi:hypothetical protein
MGTTGSFTIGYVLNRKKSMNKISIKSRRHLKQSASED